MITMQCDLDTNSNSKCLQGLAHILIGCLVLPQCCVCNGLNQPAMGLLQKDCVDIGLPEIDTTLPTHILAVVMRILRQPEDYVYLGQHAYPVCLPPFLEYVKTNMDRYTQRGEPAEVLPDLIPYIEMLSKHSCSQRHLLCATGYWPVLNQCMTHCLSRCHNEKFVPADSTPCKLE